MNWIHLTFSIGQWQVLMIRAIKLVVSFCTGFLDDLKNC